MDRQSHVICTPNAAQVIKTYSPNLMVHPLMRSSPPALSSSDSGSSPSLTKSAPDTDPSQIAAQIIPMLDRLHVLVIGPGLGRDPLMQETCAKVITAAREKGIPMVLDADALLLVTKDPSLIKGYDNAVLTPNVVEFGRLTKALGVDEEVEKAEETAGETAKVEALAKALGGVMVVQKGAKDYLSDGKVTLTVDLKGGLKRSGGQGDTLTGSIATFLGWRRAYLEDLWDHGHKLNKEELIGLAVFGGSAITRVSHVVCDFSFMVRGTFAPHTSQHRPNLVILKQMLISISRNALVWHLPRRAAVFKQAISQTKYTRHF